MSKKKTPDSNQDLARSVMQSIEKQEVRMHSKWYFLALSAISVISVFIASLLAAIFISLLVRDVDYAEDLGLRDLSRDNDFVTAFPWLLLIFTAMALISTTLLVRRLEFAYKFKNHMMFGATAGLVVALGVGMSVIGISERIEDTDGLKQLQTLRSKAQESIIYGTIQTVDEDSFVLITPEEEQIVVEFNDETEYAPFHTEKLVEGEEIGVFGERIDDETWQAFKVGNKPPRARNPRVKGLQDFKKNLEQRDLLIEQNAQ